MSNLISASFAYGGSADYPGSSFDGSIQFQSSQTDLSLAIEEFVDWVIKSGAGVAAALSLTPLTNELDPEGELSYLIEQFISFKLSASEMALVQIQVALERSEAFSIAKSALRSTGDAETAVRFRELVHQCIVSENPGPLLSDPLSEFLG